MIFLLYFFVLLYFFYRLDNGNCPPGYLDIMSKCLWLLCYYNNPTGAEYVCSRNFGTLASFDETGLARITEYLNHIRARNIGINQVSHVRYLSITPYIEYPYAKRTVSFRTVDAL